MEPGTQRADEKPLGAASVVVALPILPGKEEEWRRFAQEVEENHAREYEGLRDRLGIRAGSVSLVWTPRSEMALIRAEVEDPEVVLGTLRASEEPFDAFFKEKVLELHGYDLDRQPLKQCTEPIFACTCAQSPARPDRDEGDVEIVAEREE